MNTATIQEYDDGRTYDRNAVLRIRQAWVDDHMRQREKDYTRGKVADIYCGTWNVNAKKQEGNLNEWLLPAKDEKKSDIYAIGFQEIVDLNAMNVALDGSKTKDRSDFWELQIQQCLQLTGCKYTKIVSKALVGLLLVIYADDSVAPFIRDVRVSSLGVGIMGLMGNKGGVAVRMSLYDSSICFVCSHLAAHRENVVGRNSDFKNIIQRIMFAAVTSGKEDIDDEDASSSELLVVRPRRGAALAQTQDQKILDHELIFWVGDLNYRMVEDVSKEQVFQYVESKDVVSLRKYDQLNIERAAGRVFQGFEEPAITFLPTYKYQPGTDLYEQRPEKKLRAPAYCDRILWKTTNTPSSVRVQNYRSASLKPSDHKPVSAHFNVDLREVVVDRETDVYNELMQKLESTHREGASVQAEVSGLQIEINDAKYDVESSSVVKIKNVGNSHVYWRFVPKLEEFRICKRWVSVDTQSGLLLPTQLAVITVKIKIDTKTAQDINQGKDTLDDLLVLRIENSIDYFVSVKAAYLRSCYGMSLEELVYTLQPVRATQLPALQIPPSELGGVPKLSIPKELWRLVDALYTGDSIREKDLFAGDADPGEVAQVRECIDVSCEFPHCTPHAIAEAIVTFIAALPYPLLPTRIYPNAETDSNGIRAFARKFLEGLAPLNYTVFVYIISFFREVLAQADYNRSTPSRLAEVCLRCMTPSATDPELTEEERDRRASKQQLLLPVLVHFLTSAVI